MNKSLYFIQYVLLFVGIYLLSVVCEGVTEFDLHRSYEEVNFYVKEFSIFEMILYRLVIHVDFVYYLIHYLASMASIPMNLVTTIIVFSYYLLIIVSIKTIFKCRISNTILLIVLFITPIIWAISVARNLTAFVFLYCAILSYYKGHKFLSILFVILSVFTHFTTLMYVAALIISVILKKWRINDKGVAIVLSVTFIVSLFSPSLLQDILLNAVSGNNLSYENYTEEVVSNFLLYDSINYADKIPVAFSYIYSVALLFFNKHRGGEFWALLFLTIMLSFFMNSYFSLVLRCMMFMPIFWGLNVGSIIKYSPTKEKKNLQFLSLIGVACVLVHLYGYRQIYFVFL